VRDVTAEFVPGVYGPYRDADAFTASWRELAAQTGARESVAGSSVEGRPVYRFDLGARDGPTVLLTALIHGIELIGSVALHDVVRELATSPRPEVAALRARVRFVVMPVLNPDALARNTARLARGAPAARRGNARGVDLNRNFPPLGPRRWFQPLAGSHRRFSPYYAGAHPFSEPEARAVGDVAAATRPAVALGFHSFGNMLLYPWAFTRAPNPRAAEYRRLGGLFARALPTARYVVRPAIDWYAIVGDLDDWLDSQFGTLAFTVEVSRLDARLFHPQRLINPFCWANPTRVDATVQNLTPAIIALLAAATR
jgi:carboxypeptidase T